MAKSIEEKIEDIAKKQLDKFDVEYHIKTDNIKSYKMTNPDLFKNKGEIPVVTNSSVDNGITGYVDLAPTEKGGIVTYSDTTTDEGIFYQPYDFVGYSHVQGVYPFNSGNWNEYILLYFVSLFKKSAKGRFDYASKFNRAIAK